VNVWETVTGNSALPIQAGNTFFDHLSNQKTGGSLAGGRADLSIQSESDIIQFTADNDKITTEQDHGTITLTQDKKGITL